MTHVEALDLDRLPEHLIVLGGGYVALELSQAFRRLGSGVTVIQTASQLADREDPDVGAALLDLFHDEGINVLLGSHVRLVEGRSGQRVTVRVESGKEKHVLAGTAEPRGFMKALIAKDTDEILGFTVFGVEASELMVAVETAMLGHLPYTVLRDAILAHPTISEGLGMLLANVPAR